MAKREWIAMVFVTAVFVAICIALGVSAWDDISAKDLLLSSFPSWLQGIGTVAAAVVGYAAYRNWTKQEILRGRAGDAKIILQQSHAVAKRVRALRGVYGTYSLPIKMRSIKQAMIPRREELARVSNVAAASLNDNIELAQELFDHGLAARLRSLLDIERDVTGAVNYMRALMLDEEDLVDDPHWQADAERELKLLGFRQIIKGMSRKASIPDEIDMKLTDTMKAISDNLRPHINYGEKS